MEYSHSLPNLMCEQVTDRSVDRKGTGQWKHQDRFTELLSYVDHKETRTFLAREHSDPKSHEHDADTTGTVSFGVFGGVLEGVFRTASKTDFQWKGTGALGDGTVQIFDYRVARTNSNLNVGAQATTVVGYHGEVFIDSATRGVRRITMVADDFRKTHACMRLRSVWTTTTLRSTIATTCYRWPRKSKLAMTAEKPI